MIATDCPDSTCPQQHVPQSSAHTPTDGWASPSPSYNALFLETLRRAGCSSVPISWRRRLFVFVVLSNSRTSSVKHVFSASGKLFMRCTAPILTKLLTHVFKHFFLPNYLPVSLSLFQCTVSSSQWRLVYLSLRLKSCSCCSLWNSGRLVIFPVPYSGVVRFKSRPDWGFSWLYSTPLRKCQDSTSSSTSFPMYYFLIILPSYTTVFELLRMVRNKLQIKQVHHLFKGALSADLYSVHGKMTITREVQGCEKERSGMFESRFKFTVPSLVVLSESNETAESGQAVSASKVEAKTSGDS